MNYTYTFKKRYFESKIITSRINDDGTSAFVDVSVFGCGGESK